MTADDDRLHAEVDRQLGEIRSSCDGLATRAGLLISATGVVATIVAARIDKVPKLEAVLAGALLALGVATLAGIAALLPWLKIGPRGLFLQSWMSVGPRPRTSSLLYDAKVLLIEGGAQRLAAMRAFFVIQAGATLVAVALGLWYSVGGR